MLAGEAEYAGAWGLEVDGVAAGKPSANILKDMYMVLNLTAC